MSTREETQLKKLSAQFGSGEFAKVGLNQDLFNKLVQPACFNQCSRKDIDIVFLNEVECMYKCMITYKQTF
jgi:hypothetical protein